MRRKEILVGAFLLIFLVFIMFFYSKEEYTVLKVVQSPCEEAVSMILSANERIYVAMYSFYYYPEFPDSCSNKIAEKIVEKYKEDVDVKVFLDDKEENEKIIAFFKGNRVPVFLYRGKYILHAKVLLVDNCVMVGSSNYTYSGLFKNQEFNLKVCGNINDILAWFGKLEEKCKRVS